MGRYGGGGGYDVFCYILLLHAGSKAGYCLFFYKKMEVSASNLLKCKLNCMQNSPMIYSDTTVFLRISCSNTKHLCRSRYLKQIKLTIVAIHNGFSDVLHFATGVALQCGDLRAIYFHASHR